MFLRTKCCIPNEFQVGFQVAIQKFIAYLLITFAQVQPNQLSSSVTNKSPVKVSRLIIKVTREQNIPLTLRSCRLRNHGRIIAIFYRFCLSTNRNYFKLIPCTVSKLIKSTLSHIIRKEIEISEAI